MKHGLKLMMMTLSLLLALFALWQVQRAAGEVRRSEEEKVRLWANAIGQRNRLSEATQEFFERATLDEQRKMRMYTEVLESFNDPNQSVDLSFSLAYIHYIVDSSETPIVITTAEDSVITVPQELAGRRLEGELLEEWSVNPPFEYRIWGMPMRLYYKESRYYTQLREVLEGLTRSFLAEITNNSVSVPVVIVDSSRRGVIASSEVGERSSEFLASVPNEPVQITLPEGSVAYVYYENSPLLRRLRWVPLLYIFIALVLLGGAWLLMRTTHRMEQERVWVGLAKETAHQLGTPLSSLVAWNEYLRGRMLTEEYAEEIGKDLRRLETITHRFSKIGSVPELKEEDVEEAVMRAVQYLEGRISKKVRFNVSFPEGERFVAPLNRHLFEWVIENLCRNAVDAMEGSGTITIVGSQDARRIQVDVSDTGRGMPTSVQKQIFDSGFTTKGRGWGLGLPLARRIMRQYHGGDLYLKYSVLGQGSTFRIVLRKK